MRRSSSGHGSGIGRSDHGAVRLSAGREQMSDETQALAFLAGANSVFVGPKVLTFPNPGYDKDAALFSRLGIAPVVC